MKFQNVSAQVQDGHAVHCIRNLIITVALVGDTNCSPSSPQKTGNNYSLKSSAEGTPFGVNLGPRASKTNKFQNGIPVFGSGGIVACTNSVISSKIAAAYYFTRCRNFKFRCWETKKLIVCRIDSDDLKPSRFLEKFNKIGDTPTTGGDY